MRRRHIKFLMLIVATFITTSLFLSAQTTPDIFAKIEADRDNIFVNEPFNLTLSVYSTKTLFREMDLSSMPNPDQLKIISNFKEVGMKQNGAHSVSRFRCKVRATTAGPINISPELGLTIITKKKDGFFFMNEIRTVRRIKVQALPLKITPIPATGRPADFSGAIGQFGFNVSVTPTDVAVGDLITAAMKISGEGYFGNNFDAPSISPGRSFKAYQLKELPVIKENERIFQQTIIPQSTNAVKISSVSFSGTFMVALSSNSNSFSISSSINHDKEDRLVEPFPSSLPCQFCC